MGKELSDAVVVHHRFVVGVVDGGLNLMLSNLLAYEPCELVIHGMARSGGDDAAFDGLSDERHVADDVEKLVTGALVVPHQRLVLDVANLCGVDMWNVEEVGKLVEFLLWNLTLVDDDGIVEVAAFDEIGLKERHDVAHEDEACGQGRFRRRTC